MGQERHPSGTPSGGRFAPTDHAEADAVTLATTPDFDREGLARQRREEMYHDRELASLELEFEMSGGRGVEVAERIDELRRRYAEPIGGAVRGTAGSWTAEATFFDRPVAGIIYDYEADPAHPDSMLEQGEAGPDRGDPLLVVWNDVGDVTDEGPRSVSLHSIPGMSERLAATRDGGGVPADVVTVDDGNGNLTATFTFDGVRVAEVRLRAQRSTGEVTVFDPTGAVVPVDGVEHRTLDVVPPRDPWRPA
jgi:hypothetical protein